MRLISAARPITQRRSMNPPRNPATVQKNDAQELRKKAEQAAEAARLLTGSKR